MVYNAGDFNTTETVHIPINSFSSDDPTASVTMTNLAAGDVEIHKDGSTTQRSSDNGVTVTIDFDSVTGNHMINIDLSDNTDAGFYSSGSRYLVRVEGTTVDGGTINAWVGGFSIDCVLRPTTAGRTVDVAATGEVGLDFDNIKDATGAHTLTNITVPTVSALTGHTAQTGDNYARLGAPAGASVSADVAAVKAETANIVADTNELQTDDVPGLIAALNNLSQADIRTAIGLATANLDTQLSAIAGYIDTEIAAIKAVIDNLPDNGALSSLATLANQTTLLTRLSAARAGYLDYINTINTALLSAYSEVTSLPASGAALADKLAFIFHQLVQKATFNKDTGIWTLYQSNGSSTLATRTLTDDGTTQTNGAMS